MIIAPKTNMTTPTIKISVESKQYHQENRNKVETSSHLKEAARKGAENNSNSNTNICLYKCPNSHKFAVSARSRRRRRLLANKCEIEGTTRSVRQHVQHNASLALPNLSDLTD